MYHTSFKQQKKIPGNFFYLAATLKDSRIEGDKLIPALTKEAYGPALDRFIENLSGTTLTRVSYSRLRSKIAIVPNKEGAEWQVRIIVRCPGGWSLPQFEAAALREWKKTPWAGEVIFNQIVNSPDMQTSFLEETWKGKLG